MKKVCIVLFTIVLASMFITGTSQTGLSKTITLKMSNPDPEPVSPSESIKWWCNEVEKRTDGRVKFQKFFAGSLLKGGEGLDGVKNGLVDVVRLNTPLYTDKLALCNVGYAVLFSSPDLEVTRQLWKTMFANKAVLNDVEKYNAKFLFASPIGSRDFQSTSPICTVKDFDGKKVASIGTYYPRALQKVGAVGVTIPIPDRYMSLKTGIVSAQMLPLEDSFALKGYEVAKYQTMSGLSCDLVGIALMNRKVWDSLPADIQKIMMEVAEDATKWNVQNIRKKRENARVKMEAAGVTFCDFPYEEIIKWCNLMDNYAAEWAKETDAKGLPGTDIMRLFLDTSKKLGYKFPRDWAAGM